EFRRVLFRSSVRNPSSPKALQNSASLCRPRFSFFYMQLSKNSHSNVSRGSAFRPQTHRASLASHTEISPNSASQGQTVPLASSVAAVVGEAYIGDTNSNRQALFSKNPQLSEPYTVTQRRPPPSALENSTTTRLRPKAGESRRSLPTLYREHIAQL